MTDLFCQIVRGGQVAWPERRELRAPEVFEAARDAGLHLLIAQRLRHAPGASSCPAALRARFEEALRDEVATEQLTRRELRRVIAVLHADGVHGLLFKGAALGFTHYPDPALRPRVDVDVLVRSDEVPITARSLERMGYRRAVYIAGEMGRAGTRPAEIEHYLASSQIAYDKVDRYGVQHTFDVHWKVSIPLVFADLLSTEELAAHSVSLPQLDEPARSVGPVHALAIACIHRVAHHQCNDPLIWLYDIHLLARALRTEEAEEFLCLARSRRISTVCAQGLSLAQERFGTRLPAGLLHDLRDTASRNPREPSAVYVRGGMRKVDILRSDLVALPGWRQRFQLLGEHVFPSAVYMREVYGTSGRALLPLLYAWRFIEGARGWFRRGRPNDRARAR